MNSVYKCIEYKLYYNSKNSKQFQIDIGTFFTCVQLNCYVVEPLRSSLDLFLI